MLDVDVLARLDKLEKAIETMTEQMVNITIAAQEIEKGENHIVKLSDLMSQIKNEEFNLRRLAQESIEQFHQQRNDFRACYYEAKHELEDKIEETIKDMLMGNKVSISLRLEENWCKDYE